MHALRGRGLHYAGSADTQLRSNRAHTPDETLENRYRYRRGRTAPPPNVSKACGLTAGIPRTRLGRRGSTSDGVIATNTTISRDAVQGLPHANETGGLSGAPVFEASNRVIRLLRAALGSGYPIIGVGGVLGGEDARAKLQAGADLVQLYTGLIYKGPALVPECAKAMARL